VVTGIRDERRFRKRMKARDRYLTLDRLRQRLEAGEGTLIRESGVKGPVRIWWTEDDIPAKGTLVTTDEEYFAVFRGEPHAYNLHCWQEYLAAETGKAILTSIPPRYAAWGKLARMFPKVPVVTVIPARRSESSPPPAESG